MTTLEELESGEWSDFFDALRTWTDSRYTFYLLGRVLGLFDQGSFVRLKAVFYDMNPLESMLDGMVKKMVEVGLLECSSNNEYRTSPERLAHWRGFENRA